MSDSESEKLLKQFEIKPEQLPKILSNDPVIISIGAKPGQIVKVVRKSQTAKYATAYRIVIESEKNWEMEFSRLDILYEILGGL